MYPGLIPTMQDLVSEISRSSNESASHDVINTNWIFLFESWRGSRTKRSNSKLFNFESKLPNRLIKLGNITKEKAKDYCLVNDQKYYPDHNDIDEMFHFVHNHSQINNLAEQVVIEALKHRLKHPIIVYSAVTQDLVERYRETHSHQETKDFLKANSTLPWIYVPQQDHWVPRSKWYKVTQTTEVTNFWPGSSYEAFLNHLIRRNTYHPHLSNSTNFLQGYTTKATDKFDFKYGKTPAYKTALGIELELDFFTTKDIPILEQTLGDHAIFKRDGSVSNGVEICTAPATLDIHKQVFMEFFNKQTDLQASSNCGLHVHVDRAALTKTQIPKIMMFMNHQDNNTLIEKIAGRAANNYCQVTSDLTWEKSILQTSSNRYTRVNLCPEFTIEFRLFASTKDYKQFSRCLEFVQAVVDYTKAGEHDCSIKELTDQKNFLKYLTTHRQFYPELHKFIYPPKERAI